VIPKIDHEVGISVYSTTFGGCGGKIKDNVEDFQVFEILSEQTLSKIKPIGDYAVYKLIKKNIDTNHALKIIYRKYGLRVIALGLKDAFAVTEQFVCAMKKTKPLEDFNTNKISLKKIGFVNKPLSKKDMIGNQFKIKIIESTTKIEQFDEYDKILNFFGYQRFGSKRAVTHLIGKAILQRNFSKAVNLLLSFTSPYDSKENTQLRTMMKDKTNYSKIIQEIPPQMDLEKTVLYEMIQHDDPKKAIKSLPITIRRFFIQAYQSFIFNKTLSMSFQDGDDLFTAKEGDVCYDAMGKLGKYELGKEQRLAIPIVGYSYYKKTRFHNQIAKILETEEIHAKDFFIKEMQEVSNEGGFRNSSIQCSDSFFSDGVFQFSLSRGSYATIVLREIMKPADPLLVGF